MTNNTQSLLDRMAEALRDVTEVVEMTIGFGLFDHSEPHEGSPALKAQQVLAEYEAHKANHTEDMRDMVKSSQCDAERHRWLRDNSLNNPNLRIKYRAANSDWTSISELGELDSVIDCGIDAARAQAEKEWLVENTAVVENMAVI